MFSHSGAGLDPDPRGLPCYGLRGSRWRLDEGLKGAFLTHRTKAYIALLCFLEASCPAIFLIYLLIFSPSLPAFIGYSFLCLRDEKNKKELGCKAVTCQGELRAVATPARQKLRTRALWFSWIAGLLSGVGSTMGYVA